MANHDLKNLLSTLDDALAHLEKDKGTHFEGGLVKSIKDGVLHIEGASTLRMGEVVEIGDTKVEALVVEVATDQSAAVALQPSDEITAGQVVRSTGKQLSIAVNDDILGRVLDPLGEPLDGGSKIKSDTRMPLESMAPGVMQRQSVDTPVQTGILAIDALIPIGRGQRELIIGDRQTGKTAVAIDTILNQRDQNMICIYVSIGQRAGRTAQVIRTLQEKGAMDYTVVVSASASDPAVLQYLAPYAGCAIGEYFMNKGRDVLVVYDDLSKQAVAYRELSLLLRKPPGREAYPGDVFYIHSRLLERAARLNEKLGGGSLTALPIIETQAGDVSAYVPTNVISITDGQIFLASNLFYRGVRPAIDVGISVSRVGGAAQTKVMKKVSGTAKLDLAQYYELAAFAQFGSELDSVSQQQLVRGERMVEAMKQKQNHPRALWKQVVILRAVSTGKLDSMEVDGVASALEKLIETFEVKYPNIVSEIEDNKVWSDDLAKAVDEAVNDLV